MQVSEETVCCGLDGVTSEVERPPKATLFLQASVPKRLIFYAVSPGSSMAGINSRMVFKDFAKKKSHTHTPKPG